MIPKNGSGAKDVLAEVWDILFVMILCFATLLATMLVKGRVITGTDGGGSSLYRFDPGKFVLTAVFLVAYLLFVVKRSEKDLKSFYSSYYGGDRVKSSNRSGSGEDR